MTAKPRAEDFRKLAENFSLFVSCVEGKPVTRYGSRSFIGAIRPAKPAREDANQVIYDPKLIVAIPKEEHARFRKEYDRVIADGDLVVHKAEAWVAQAERAERESAELRKQKKAKAEAAEAKAKADAAKAAPVVDPPPKE